MLPTSVTRFRQPPGPRALSAAPFQLPPTSTSDDLRGVSVAVPKSPVVAIEKSPLMAR